MVKPLYIVFFFFVLSLCEEECVTLTKKENNFECNNANEAIDICKQLSNDQAEGQTTPEGGNPKIILKLTEILNILQIQDKDSSAQLRITSPPQKSNENSEILTLCYEVAKPSSESTQEQQAANNDNNSSTTESKQERRMLKNEGINSPYNVLPRPADGSNQNFKDSLIMEI